MGTHLDLEQYESGKRHGLAGSSKCGGTLNTVTDGSYIRGHYLDLYSAAFILKCKCSGGHVVGAFPEASIKANALCEELLGLMAVHLLLLAVNTVSPGLTGLVRVYSDCLSALSRIAELPPYQVPSPCRHSDILKRILVNCRGLTFSRKYCHVEAHQDDKMKWEELFHEVQLNAACIAGAKAMIRRQDITDLPQQEAFLLEPICMFVEGKKMTSDMGPHIRYTVGRQVVHLFFHETSRVFTNTFDKVDWLNVYCTRNKEVPRLFQVWACKQVMNISATNKNLSRRHQDGCSDKCPCCIIHVKTAEHIILCLVVGRVEAFKQAS
jgi:hypothetical protein